MASSSPIVSANMSSPTESPLFKVGVYWAEKKWIRFDEPKFRALLLEKRCELIKLNLDEPLDQQGPFAAIVHKVSDLMARSEAGDLEARKRIENFEKYLHDHPEVVLIDKLDGVRLLMHRFFEYQLIANSNVAKKGVVYVPPFIDLTSNDVQENAMKLKERGVSFPLVCKPIMAHGSTQAHKMSLVFCETGLSEVRPPCVAQSFLNHNARLFKLFVLRDKCYVVERPSLKNFQPQERATVHFDAHSISKPDSSSSLTELDEEDVERQEMKETLSQDVVNAVVNEFREKLNLTLFGIDIIVEKETGRHAIIDVNVFPGYEGVPSFLQDLADMISHEVHERTKILHNECNHKSILTTVNGLPDCASLLSSSNAVSKVKTIDNERKAGNTDIDSGIDTSDSCDEKKKTLNNHPILMKSEQQHQMRVKRREATNALKD